MIAELDAPTMIEREIISAQHELDQRQYENFVQYFTEGGKLFRPTSDEPLVGRKSILESYKANPANRCNRHIISNVMVTMKGERQAMAVTYVTVYSADTTDEPRPVFGYPLSRCLLGEYHDQWEKHGQQWLLAERKAVFTLNTMHGNDE